MKDRIESYTESGEKLLVHLDAKLNAESGFPDEPSWGYAFIMLAVLQYNPNFPENRLAQRALRFLSNQNSSTINFPWEFIVYAVQNSCSLISNKKIDLPFNKYNKKGTRMLNWYLLRQLNKSYFRRLNIVEIFQLRMAKLFYTTKEGLILDEQRTRSLQYHAFCLFVLAELMDRYPEHEFIQEWFCNGIKYSLSTILDDGTALYIGRGQEQIFGYGALIYSLEKYNKNIQKIDPYILNALQKRVLGFRRDDGSFPLVLRKRQPEQGEVSFKKDKPLGWYGYNTLYDYQPFLAYCLLKTGRL